MTVPLPFCHLGKLLYQATLVIARLPAAPVHGVVVCVPARSPSTKFAAKLTLSFSTPFTLHFAVPSSAWLKVVDWDGERIENAASFAI